MGVRPHASHSLRLPAGVNDDKLRIDGLFVEKHLRRLYCVGVWLAASASFGTHLVLVFVSGNGLHCLKTVCASTLYINPWMLSLSMVRMVRQSEFLSSFQDDS